MSDTVGRAGVDATRSIAPDQTVVYSLVRTLNSSFDSASKAYRKLKSPKLAGSHLTVPSNGDGGVRVGRERRLSITRRSRKDSHSDDERSRYHIVRKPSRSRSRRGRDDDDANRDELSLDTAAIRVQTEYDNGYNMLREQFAIGDLLTRNQLQQQIIAVQGALLSIYEDSHELRAPSDHLRNLVHTVQKACSSAIDAVADQRKRMRPPLPFPPDTHELHMPDMPHMPVPGAFPTSHPPSVHSLSTSSSASSSKSLYCYHARELQQDSNLRLTDNFKPDGNQCCPFCRMYIASRTSQELEIVKTTGTGRRGVTTFHVQTRFLVKSHSAGGGFACVLCSEYGLEDKVFPDVRALVNHIWSEHPYRELVWDGDLREVVDKY